MDTTFATLAAMAWSVPQVLIELAAIIVAVVQWRKHSAVSLTVFAAAALSLLSVVVRAAQTAWQMKAFSEGVDHAQLSTQLMMFGGVQVMLGATSHILLLVAAFGWRSAESGA
jgi:hypothetical protein